jgi:cell wall-associated NlpC family hydrolase
MADKALTYKGHAYAYGGAPGKNGTDPWDCSSMYNWVIGHDFNHAIPGASNYDGSSHGPPTGSWGIWPGLQHIQSNEVQAGDLIVWVGHMGMAISNTQMISALNSNLGTLVTPIAGYGNGPLLCYGRLK